MTEKLVQVTFPILRGRRRFMIEKGRRWSVIEHLLLEAVARNPRSAADLASESNLPRRVVVEAFIRLMRAGWAEISVTPQGPIFKATALGALNATYEQLPAATTIVPSWRAFAIDQVTGCVFRSRELTPKRSSELPHATVDELVVHLPVTELENLEDLGSIFAVIEGEDEFIVGVYPSVERLIPRFALVTVRGSVIEGLPSRASNELRDLILRSAEDARSEQRQTISEIGTAPRVLSPVGKPPLAAVQSRSAARMAVFELNDLILDGADHKRALETTLKNARNRVIIHSTFVRDDTSKAILPTLLQAAAKGTRIDILWGQDEDPTGPTSSRRAAEKLEAEVAAAGRSDAIVVHPFSTQSHAKMVIADDGKNSWFALLGSCNWLASEFQSFEASLRLRDPALVGALTKHVATMSIGRRGLWDEFAVGLTTLGRRIESASRPPGRTVPMRLLLGADHAELALEAKDRAKQRIFVTSHRLGIAAKPMVILPALTAAKESSVSAALYYGRTTGALTGTTAAELSRQFGLLGIRIRPVHKPRLHAKVLGWDDDALAVSSLNWLSADPSHTSPLREIGIFIEAPKVADDFIRRFEFAQAE